MDEEAINLIYFEAAEKNLNTAQQILINIQPEEQNKDSSMNDLTKNIVSENYFDIRDSNGIKSEYTDQQEQIYPSLEIDNNQFQQYQEQNNLEQQLEQHQNQEQYVPKENIPYIELSDSIFREILLSMRVQLKSDAYFFQNLKILQTILKNIINEPTNKKFQRLRLSNEKLKTAVSECEQSRFILEMLGFEKVQWYDDSQFDAIQEDYYILNQQRIDMREFNIVVQIINEVFSKNNMSPLTINMENQSGNLASNFSSKEEFKTSKITVPVNSRVKAQVDKIKNTENIMKSKLQSAHQERSTRQQYQPEIYQAQRELTNQNIKLESYMDQIKYYREMQRRNYRQEQVGKVITSQDLQKKIDDETRFKNNATAAGKGDSERWGIRALELTNQFRASHGLPALSWNQQLHDIGQPHNVNMATGKYPVGHEGFKERMRQVPFFVRSFSENVAYNYNMADPVEVAVNGWINSPGHRKNMLANNNLCGISVYCYYGRYYFTQLFALA
ncbi:scp-like extracellular [Stylonychia lemnae]|uniref:Scp-like extracellular n=1 Tax=Stylonychia lemnae TaxID=5949 RepID=A0A077ZXE6_STYLE|nr:scp-like extracellular [Stylonychia lemnae]|eukprot:CDW73897.1 scp-like extracellular [Stylonychia lemnae]